MKASLTVWVLLVSTSLARKCSDLTDYLSDKRKLVKYDTFFEGFEQNKAYSFEERERFLEKMVCKLSVDASNSYIRIHWFKDKGYFQDIAEYSCEVFTFQNDSNGYLQVNNPAKLPATVHLILGFYIDKDTQQRVLYMGLVGNYFTEFLPIEPTPELVSKISANCDSTRLDSTLLANSKSVKLDAKDTLGIFLLCGAYLLVWFASF